jgi:hypothetical protein
MMAGNGAHILNETTFVRILESAGKVGKIF